MKIRERLGVGFRPRLLFVGVWELLRRGLCIARVSCSDPLRLNCWRIVRKICTEPVTFCFKGRPYLKWTPNYSLNYSIVFSEKSCNFWLVSLMPVGFFVEGDSPFMTSPITWRAWSWTQAGRFNLQMSTFEKYTLREIKFILYKVGYLCTVNKYITNLSCLKKVLPFWCLFLKLMLIYKKVLFLLVLFVCFFQGLA